MPIAYLSLTSHNLRFVGGTVLEMFGKWVDVEISAAINHTRDNNFGRKFSVV